MKTLEEKFWMTEKEILDYAKKRDDLWEYEDEYLLDFIRGNQHWDLDDILDEFSHYWIEDENRIENWKDDLFDDLNNILFSKHSELTEYIKKWLIEHKLADDDRIVGELASDFIDRKELYDLDYED